MSAAKKGKKGPEAVAEQINAAIEIVERHFKIVDIPQNIANAHKNNLLAMKSRRKVLVQLLNDKSTDPQRIENINELMSDLYDLWSSEKLILESAKINTPNLIEKKQNVDAIFASIDPSNFQHKKTHDTSDLERQLAVLTQKVEELKGIRDGLKMRLDAAKSKSTPKQQMMELKSTNKKMSKIIQSIQDQLNEFPTRIEKLKTENNNKLKEKNKELKDIKDKIYKNTEDNEYIKRSNELDQLNEMLKDDIKTGKERQQELVKQVKEAKQRNEIAKNLKKEIEEQNKDLEELKEIVMKEDPEYQKKVLKEKIEECTNKAKQIRAEYNRKKKVELVDLTNQKEFLEGEAAFLSKQMKSQINRQKLAVTDYLTRMIAVPPKLNEAEE